MYKDQPVRYVRDDGEGKTTIIDTTIVKPEPPNHAQVQVAANHIALAAYDREGKQRNSFHFPEDVPSAASAAPKSPAKPKTEAPASNA